MAKTFKLQDPGEGIHEAEILEVHVDEGDSVTEGETVLVSVETDKAAIDIPASFSGRIEQLKVSEGDIANVGDVLLTYVEAEEDGTQQAERAGGGDDSEDQHEAGKDTGDEAAGSRQSHPGGDEDKTSQTRQGKGDDTERNREQSEPGKDADEAAEASSGKKAATDRNANRSAGAQAQADKDVNAAHGHDAVPASPATRRLARELDVELETVEGSGPDGRVESDDVRKAAEESGGGGQARARPEAADLPDFSEWGDVEEVPLRGIRRRIAKKMQRAWREIPHVMHADMVDITDLEAFRQQHEDDFADDDGKLTVTVFVLKAVASALGDFPRFNASLDARNGKLVLKHYIHIGVATDTDNGLLVPVIRDVDKKSMTELAEELDTLSGRARSGDLKPREMRGGSITITNSGAIGGTFFTPIINHPEVAIIGLGAAQRETVIREAKESGHEFESRVRLPLIISFDHRVNDGADAARFARSIGNLLHSPENFLLQVS